MHKTEKWLLRSHEFPVHWINLAALLGEKYPPILTDSNEPIKLESLEKIFSHECAKIDLLDGIYKKNLKINIPEKVLKHYRKYRPTPLFRAHSFEQCLDYKGKIYYKREDICPTGSHKPNTAYPQAYYAWKQGLKGLITDTGAGQWGTAIALACSNFGLDCIIFMTRNSYIEKPYRKYLMQLSGAKVYSSPSNTTEKGRLLLEKFPEHSGSLGIGMGEAMELVRRQPDYRLALGCMSYYAAVHQTIVGQELITQLEHAECEPDILIACVGGGTNLFGFMAPYIQKKIEGEKAPILIAAESGNIPVFTKGKYKYDYADSFALTFKILMYTLGSDFIPPKIHSGGLRYHGKSPILSLLVKEKLIQATAITQEEAFKAGKLFFECEGVLPAPESNHAIAATIRSAKKAKQEGMEKAIVFCLSGTGYLDLNGYAKALDFQTNLSL